MYVRFTVCPAALLFALVVPVALLDCNDIAGIEDSSLHPPDAGAGGSAGGGAGGMPGRGGAAGAAGSAGGAAGGKAACAGDAACVGERGVGSFCVAGACTEPAGACDASRLAVVDPTRDASAEPSFAGGCFYRSIDEALTASLGGSARRLAVFADAASSVRDVLVAEGVSFEGYASSAGAHVKLTVNAPAGQPLVSLKAGASLRGFALDGGGANNVTAIATLGGASLAGPLRVERASIGLDARSINGPDGVTVVGSAAAPVVFSENVQAIVQGSALSLTGDGAAGGLVIENSKTAGVIARATKLVLDGVVVRGQATGDGVRSERVGDVVVKNSVFVQNQTSILLAGDNENGSSFEGVIIADNDFTDAVLPGPTGSVICGVDVLTGSALHLPGDNRFPGGRLCQSALKGTCSGGVDVGAYSATTFDVQCQ